MVGNILASFNIPQKKKSAVGEVNVYLNSLRNREKFELWQFESACICPSKRRREATAAHLKVQFKKAFVFDQGKKVFAFVFASLRFHLWEN